MGKLKKSELKKSELKKSELKKCIIVGSGDFNDNYFSYQKQDYIIAADGGYRYLENLGIVPKVIIGDFDSMDTFTEKMSKSDCEIIRLSIAKDDTDMLAAIRLALSRGYGEIHLYGATGGRLDHTLANIQCLTYIKRNHANGYIHDKDMVITILKDETISFTKIIKGRMSLFAIDQKVTGVNLRGFRYPLIDATVTNDFPIGISNEFIGMPAEIQVKSGMVLIMYTETMTEKKTKPVE